MSLLFYSLCPHEITTTAAWIVSALQTMTPQARQELIHLIEGMSNAARLERLMGDET